MAEATNATILDLDAMLDSSLDAIPEAPDYQNPPPGLYLLVVEDAAVDSYKDKEQNEKARLKITYKVGATIETKEIPVADGTLFTETFTATEQGLSFFKKQAKNILNVSSLDGVPMREVLSSLKGVEFKASLTTSTTKNSTTGQVYENVRIRPQHAEEE